GCAKYPRTPSIHSTSLSASRPPPTPPIDLNHRHPSHPNFHTMKIITKEEEAAHYSATVRGGLLGGVVGLAAGTGAVWLASKRFPGFKTLTLPFRVFLAVST